MKNVEGSKNLFGHESGCFDLVLGTTNQYRKDGKVLPHPGLNDPVQIGHPGMAKGADKFSRTNLWPLPVQWIDSFFIFFFVLEFFSQTSKCFKIICSALMSL